MKYALKTFLVATFVLPALAFAQFTQTAALISNGQLLVRRLITVFAGLAVLVFIWGIVKYIWAQGNESAKADGKKIMVGGVIALFVLFSIYGIITLLQRELTVPQGVISIPPPQLGPGQ